MPQPAAPSPPRLNARNSTGGHDHAAERAGRRDGGVAWLGELAVGELLLDLEADDEEEQRHQSVVDPVPEILGDGVAAEVDGELGGPQVLVGRGPRRVRPHQRDHARPPRAGSRRTPRCAGTGCTGRATERARNRSLRSQVAGRSGPWGPLLGVGEANRRPGFPALRPTTVAGGRSARGGCGSRGGSSSERDACIRPSSTSPPPPDRPPLQERRDRLRRDRRRRGPGVHAGHRHARSAAPPGCIEPSRPGSPAGTPTSENVTCQM